MQLRWLPALALALVSVFGLSAQSPLTVIVVRHAERASQTEPDSPLSPAGHKRAEQLASTLADSGTSAIFVTDYKRTQQTARPLATRLHIAPEVIPAAKPEQLFEAIHKHASGTILVVGHGNTVPGLVSKLGGPTLNLPDNEFDDLFVLTLTPGQPVAFLRLHYGDPSASSLVPPVKMLEDRTGK